MEYMILALAIGWGCTLAGVALGIGYALLRKK